MYTVTKEIHWCMGHRLTHGYEGKCKSLHGHNYRVFVSLTRDRLNKVGMVVDFGDIKRLIEKWINDNWDHAVLVDESDLSLIAFLQEENQRHFILKEDCNSTAEWMSEFLFNLIRQLLVEDGLAGVTVESVTVYETNTSYATYTPRRS